MAKTLTILFWNINNNPVIPQINRLAKRYDLDILILTESALSPGELLLELNSTCDQSYFKADFLCKQITIYTKFSDEFIKPIMENDRLTIRKLTLPAIKEILIVAVHLPSKLHLSSESQRYECVDLVDEIISAERKVGHERTIVVGDFNMNPFEAGLVSARGLNSVMSKNIAVNKSRIVQRKEYTYFYNPMWGCFGDIQGLPPGTYYYQSSEHVTYHWNIFDQVLIRPELVQDFVAESLKILDSDGEETFCTPKGLPKKEKISDHLPITFTISL